MAQTLYLTLADGRKIYGPPISAAYLRKAAAERAERDNHQWIAWGKEPYHYFIEGNSLCKDEWVGSFAYSSKGPPKKVLRCKECQRLNEKRIREEKRIEKLAAD